MKWGDGFLLVYSINNRQSFEFLETMKNRLYDLKKASQLPILVLGNKKDMDHERQVPTEEGEKDEEESNIFSVMVFLKLSRDIF